MLIPSDRRETTIYVAGRKVGPLHHVALIKQSQRMRFEMEPDADMNPVLEHYLTGKPVTLESHDALGDMNVVITIETVTTGFSPYAAFCPSFEFSFTQLEPLQAVEYAGG